VQAKKRGKKKLGHRYSINTIVQATSSWHSSSGSIGSPESFLSAQSQKLSLEAFLHTALLSLCQPARSLANWAASLSALQGQIFSKQALHKRCHSRSRSLCPAPARRTFRPSGFAGGGSRAFSSLFPCSAPRQYHPAAVPGAGLGFSSQRQSQPPLQQRSEAPRRLRAVEPALGLFPTQPFYPYRSSGSGLCLDWIQPGDLLLRDLGYAVIEGWQALLKRGAYFVRPAAGFCPLGRPDRSNSRFAATLKIPLCPQPPSATAPTTGGPTTPLSARQRPARSALASHPALSQAPGLDHSAHQRRSHYLERPKSLESLPLSLAYRGGVQSLGKAAFTSLSCPKPPTSNKSCSWFVSNC